MEKIGFADLEKLRDAGIVSYENGRFKKSERRREQAKSESENT